MSKEYDGDLLIDTYMLYEKYPRENGHRDLRNVLRRLLDALESQQRLINEMKKHDGNGYTLYSKVHTYIPDRPLFDPEDYYENKTN